MTPTEAAAPLRLGVRDVPTLARIAVLWPAAAGLKRSLSLPRLARSFDTSARGGAVAPWRAARLIDGALRRAYRRSPGYCVERSLLLFHLLRRGGHPVRLCFGVMPEDGRLAGHAWVELAGEPVAEAADPRDRFRTTYAYPEDAAPPE